MTPIPMFVDARRIHVEEGTGLVNRRVLYLIVLFCRFIYQPSLIYRSGEMLCSDGDVLSGDIEDQMDIMRLNLRFFFFF